MHDQVPACPLAIQRVGSPYLSWTAARVPDDCAGVGIARRYGRDAPLRISYTCLVNVRVIGCCTPQIMRCSDHCAIRRDHEPIEAGYTVGRSRESPPRLPGIHGYRELAGRGVVCTDERLPVRCRVVKVDELSPIVECDSSPRLTAVLARVGSLTDGLNDLAHLQKDRRVC